MKRINILLILLCFVVFSFGLFSCSNTNFLSSSSNIQYIEQNIGEKFIFDTFKIKVNSYETEQYVNSYNAGQDNLWITIFIEIENIGNTNASVNDFATYIQYVNENGDASKFYSSWGNDYGYIQKYKYINNFGSILPYGKISGMYTYKVPSIIITDEMKNNEHFVSLNTNFEFHFMKNSIYRDKEIIVRL